MTKVLHIRCPCKFMQGVPEIHFEKLAPMQLHVGTRIIYIYTYLSDERNIPEVEMKTI